MYDALVHIRFASTLHEKFNDRINKLNGYLVTGIGSDKLSQVGLWLHEGGSKINDAKSANVMYTSVPGSIIYYYFSVCVDFVLRWSCYRCCHGPATSEHLYQLDNWCWSLCDVFQSFTSQTPL